MDNESAGQIAGWLWSKRSEIATQLSDLYRWFKGRSEETETSGILILGSGGAGKSTLGKILSGEFDFLLDAPARYSESLNIERHALKDDPKVEIVLPPGQPHRRGATWGDLHADLAAGKYRGVILISAYGYHSIGQLAIRDHRLYDGDKSTFLDVFLKAQRDDELQILQELKPHLSSSSGRVWLLSLITKQDLWCKQRSAVEKFYREEEYAAHINDLVIRLGHRDFRHELVFTSLVISNFVTGKGEKLKSNAEGYDHLEQANSLRRLFETVDALRQWEGGR